MLSILLVLVAKIASKFELAQSLIVCEGEAPETHAFRRAERKEKVVLCYGIVIASRVEAPSKIRLQGRPIGMLSAPWAPRSNLDASSNIEDPDTGTNSNIFGSRLVTATYAIHSGLLLTPSLDTPE